MTTRKGINISGNYAGPMYCMPCSLHVLCIFFNERSDKVILYILFKTQRPSDAVF